MKKLIVLMAMFSCVGALADNSCPLHAKSKSDCDVVKVVTRCDVEKYRLQKQIAVLEQRIKELQATPRVVQSSYVSREKYVDRIVEKKVYVEKKVVKHSILSLYLTRDVSGTSVSQSGNTATADVQTKYEPGIKYQYQFGFGLVPEVGINVKGNPMFGLGWEF